MNIHVFVLQRLGKLYLGKLTGCLGEAKVNRDSLPKISWEPKVPPPQLPPPGNKALLRDY